MSSFLEKYLAHKLTIWMIRNGEMVSLEPHPVRPEPELVGLFQVQQKISEKKILIVKHVNVHFNPVMDPLQSEKQEETEKVIKMNNLYSCSI